MTQSFFESQIAEQPQSETEMNTDSSANDPSATLALSAADFSALEDRVSRAVKLVKAERQGRAEAEQRAERIGVELQDQQALVKSLQEEVRALNAERDQVRQRVERLLSQLDALEV